MKIKSDFITNSSSTNYIILNKTKTIKTLVDFVNENPNLITKFAEEYSDCYEMNDRFSQENLLKSAEENNMEFPALQKSFCSFGDEDRTLIGLVFDYILRDGGESESFEWFYHSPNR